MKNQKGQFTTEVKRTKDEAFKDGFSLGLLLGVILGLVAVFF